MIDQKKFPKYFVVDETIFVEVNIDPKTGDVIAKNQFGYEYEPIKALYEGVPSDQASFNRASKAAAASS